MSVASSPAWLGEAKLSMQLSSIPPRLPTEVADELSASNENSNPSSSIVSPYFPRAVRFFSPSISLKPRPPTSTPLPKICSDGRPFPLAFFPEFDLRIFPWNECPRPSGSFGRIDTPPIRSNCKYCARPPFSRLRRPQPFSGICPRTSRCRPLLARNRCSLPLPSPRPRNPPPLFWIGKCPPRTSCLRCHARASSPRSWPCRCRTLSPPFDFCFDPRWGRHLIAMDCPTIPSLPLARSHHPSFYRPLSQPSICGRTPHKMDVPRPNFSISSRLAGRPDHRRNGILPSSRKAPPHTFGNRRRKETSIPLISQNLLQPGPRKAELFRIHRGRRWNVRPHH